MAVFCAFKTKIEEGDGKRFARVGAGTFWGVGGIPWRFAELGNVSLEAPEGEGCVAIKVKWRRRSPWAGQNNLSPTAPYGSEGDPDYRPIPTDEEMLAGLEKLSHCAADNVAPELVCGSVSEMSQSGYIFFPVAKFDADGNVTQILKSDFFFPGQHDPNKLWESQVKNLCAEEYKASKGHPWKVSARVRDGNVVVTCVGGLVFFSGGYPFISAQETKEVTFPLEEKTHTISLSLKTRRENYTFDGVFEFPNYDYPDGRQEGDPIGPFTKWQNHVNYSAELIVAEGSTTRPARVGEYNEYLQPVYESEGTELFALATVKISQTDSGAWKVAVSQLLFSDIFLQPAVSR